MCWQCIFHTFRRSCQKRHSTLVWLQVGKWIAMKTPQENKEPATGISLLFGVLLLVAIYGFGFLIASNYTGTSTALFDTLRTYQVFCSIVVTFFAVPGLDPNKRGFWRYVGIFILSAIPIAGWIVLFWAGKGIARSLTQKSPPEREPDPAPILTPRIQPIPAPIPDPEQTSKDNSTRNIVLWVVGIVAFFWVLNYFSQSSPSAPAPTPTRTWTLIPIITPRPRQTSTPKPISLRACVTNATIRIRKGPGTQYEAIDGLVSGTCMQVLGRNQDSSWVYMVSEENKAGWVSASLLTITGNVNRVSIKTDSGIAHVPPTAKIQPTVTRKALVFASSTPQSAVIQSVMLCSQTINRVGDLVSCKIERAYCDYRPDVDGSPTFCNDRPYPNQNFALVVFSENWSDYDGYCIVVKGVVDRYGGVPQILASSRSQISYCE